MRMERSISTRKRKRNLKQKKNPTEAEIPEGFAL